MFVNKVLLKIYNKDNSKYLLVLIFNFILSYILLLLKNHNLPVVETPTPGTSNVVE